MCKSNETLKERSALTAGLTPSPTALIYKKPNSFKGIYSGRIVRKKKKKKILNIGFKLNQSIIQSFQNISPCAALPALNSRWPESESVSKAGLKSQTHQISVIYDSLPPCRASTVLLLPWPCMLPRLPSAEASWIRDHVRHLRLYPRV